MIRESLIGAWCLPGRGGDRLERFLQSHPRWLAVLRGEWDVAIEAVGRCDNILLRIPTIDGHWTDADHADEWMNEARQKDHHTLEYLAIACRDAGTKLWLCADVEPAINEHLSPTATDEQRAASREREEATAREYADYEYDRTVTLLNAFGHLGVGSVVLNLSRGTYNAERLIFEWTQQALDAIDEYPEQVLLGLHGGYGSIWPWTYMGANQSEDLPDNPTDEQRKAAIVQDPFPVPFDPHATIPSYLTFAFQEVVPPKYHPFILQTEAGFDDSPPPLPQRPNGDNYGGVHTLLPYWREEWHTLGIGPYPGDTAAFMILLKWLDDLAIVLGIAGLIYYTIDGPGHNDEWHEMIPTFDMVGALADYIEERGDASDEPSDEPPDIPPDEPPADDQNVVAELRLLVKELEELRIDDLVMEEMVATFNQEVLDSVNELQDTIGRNLAAKDAKRQVALSRAREILAVFE